MAAQGLRSVVIKKYIYHTVVLMEGSKGPIQAKRKIIRCIASRKDGTRNYVKPGEDIWLYIRLYENGDTKYFISNARAETSAGELGRAATLRWPIEQCFEECKSNLEMSHYECRSYPGWMLHMSFVMAAHLFTFQVRIAVKKRNFSDNANDSPINTRDYHIHSTICIKNYKISYTTEPLRVSVI